ncbi:MAG: oxidoreductase [Alphaproteobacteria bacterium]|nr:MAG: oxidoreductase [Alphaproteobacteria bacterium]
MKNVRIYPQSKSQAQSGRGKASVWIIEPEWTSSRQPEPVMGWTSAGDTLSQVNLKFSSQSEAEEFAKSKGWRYTVTAHHERTIKPRHYGDNHVYDPDVEK